MYELTVVVPAFNERDNVEPLLTGLSAALVGIAWEVVFIDDDSFDGTSELLREFARSTPNVRHLLRVGRRGLSSACIEGMLTASSPFVAVIDADFQHDESLLPRMLEAMKRCNADIAVGTRFEAGGSCGDFAGKRFVISKMGSRLAKVLLKAETSGEGEAELQPGEQEPRSRALLHEPQQCVHDQDDVQREREIDVSGPLPR